jgi:hypothetical protein
LLDRLAAVFAGSPRREVAGCGFVTAVMLCSLSGCGSLNLARTLGRGNSEVSGSLGGPMVRVGDAVTPLPLMRLAARHGITDDLDLMGHLSLETVPSPALGLSFGFVGQMTRTPGGLALAFSGRLNALIDLDDAVAPRFFPEFGLHAELPLSPTFQVFFGAAMLMQLDAPRARPSLFASPYLGLEASFDPVRDAEGRATEQTGVALQLGWISPWEDSTSFVHWFPEGAGAFTVLLSGRHRFGGIGR